MLVRGQPVQVEHEELQSDLPELPHPDEVFSIIRRELNELRYREFPNRGVGSDRSPGLKTVRRGEVGSFECSRTIETQPVPIGSGRSIPSLFLLLMGSLLLLAGFWLLLRQPGLPDQPFVLAAWLPGLLTGMTAIRGGRRMVQSAWELAHTFRFRSELIRVSGSGTYRVGSVAVNSGYLGGANADQSEVLSRMYVTIHATQLTTEVCAPTQSWRPIAVAMATPRTIVSAAKSTEFSQRLEALLETLREARPTSSLPGLNPNSHGARQMLEINQQVALQHQRLGQHLGHQLVQPPIPGSEWMPGVQRLPQSDSSAGASP
jgi:hypothetical protein